MLFFAVSSEEKSCSTHLDAFEPCQGYLQMKGVFKLLDRDIFLMQDLDLVSTVAFLFSIYLS